MSDRVQGPHQPTKIDLAWRLRLLRHGRPVTIVSGLPRSGTSLVMQMLAAGGFDVVTDGVRGGDEDNPRGYYEVERVKELGKGADAGWLSDCRGRAIKIVSPLLHALPRRLNYRVIFIERDLDEVLQSQRRMLLRRSAATADDDDLRLRQGFERHLGEIRRHLRQARHTRTLYLSYHLVLAEPEKAARALNDFLGGGCDARAMAAAVDPSLHRTRRVER